MSEIKRPLEGVKVLELATFVAVPACARYLADLGAELAMQTVDELRKRAKIKDIGEDQAAIKAELCDILAEKMKKNEEIR